MRWCIKLGKAASLHGNAGNKIICHQKPGLWPSRIFRPRPAKRTRLWKKFWLGPGLYRSLARVRQKGLTDPCQSPGRNERLRKIHEIWNFPMKNVLFSHGKAYVPFSRLEWRRNLQIHKWLTTEGNQQGRKGRHQLSNVIKSENISLHCLHLRLKIVT